MKKFTILFLVIALVALAVTPTIAAKSSAQKGQLSQSRNGIQAIIDPVIANENHYYPAPDMRNKRAKATSLSGLYSIGTLAPGGYVGNYLTLHDAVNDLQASGVSGPTTFEFTDAAYSDSGVTIGGYAGQGASNPVVFQLAPANGGATITFTGGSAANQWGVQFNGAQYVTWQGTADPWVKGVANRPLVLNVDTLSQAREVFRYSNGGTDLTLKGMVLHGWRRGTGTIGPRTAVNGFHGASLTAWKNLLFQDLHVDRCGFGMNVGGPTAAIKDTNVTIQGCSFGSTGDRVERVTSAIRISNGYNYLIDNNDIAHGIALGAAPEAFSVDGIDATFGGMNTIFITNNKIHDFERSTGSGTAYGMRLHGSGSATVSDNWRIFNNMIYDLRYGGIRSGNYQCIVGITQQDGSASTGNSRIYNNTVNLSGMQGATQIGYHLGYMLSKITGTNARIANNVFSVSIGTPFYWPLDNECGSVGLFAAALLIDNNNYWTAPGFPATYVDFIQGTTSMATQYDVSYAGSDAASVFGDPGFNAADGHIDNVTVGFVSPANALAFPYFQIPQDIDKEGRDLATPDAGADEFTPVPFPNEALPLALFVPGTAGIPAGKSNVQPTARIRNNGSNTNNIPVRLVLNDGFVDVYNEVVTIPAVAPLSNYDMLTEFPILPPLAVGNYTVTLTTELPLDDNAGNDVMNTTTSAIFKVVGTYSTDFEDGGIGWSSQSDGGNNDWVLGTPNKAGFTTVAHSGTKAWTTKITGNYTDSHEASVYSPYFDLTNVPYPIVKFYHRWSFEVDWDNAILEYTADLGNTWNVLGTLNDPKGANWYNRDSATFHFPMGWCDSSDEAANVYTYSYLYTKDIGGLDQVRFRFHFGADNNTNMSGWVFDDFAINNAPSLSGKVYNDVDNSGTYNAGDAVMAGAKVYISGAASDSALTDVNGDYSFVNLFEGNYTVSTNVNFGTNVTPGGPGTYAIPLVKSVPTTADFGYYNPATASGNVWYDKNHNQLKDGSEAGMSGLQVNATGAANANDATDVNGDYSITLQVAGNYSIAQDAVPAGYMQVFPKSGGYNIAVTYGDASTGNDFGNSAAATATEFRTATYADWATAVNYKSKQKAEDRKNHIVELKFNIVAPNSGFTGFDLDFGMLTDGEVTEGKAKAVVVGDPFTQVKKVSFTGLTIDSSDTFQIDAIGFKGKVAKVKVKWTGRLVKPLTVKQTITEYKNNDPHPRMPNLNNVGEELFGGPKNYTQDSYFPTGLLVGTPQGEKMGNSVIHPKYKDVMKSLITKGVQHSATDGCLDLIGGKPMLKQQKALPQNKVDSKEFAALLTAKLNVAASVLNKFPNGLGELVYLDKTNPLNPFNDQSVNEIIAKGDSIISCLPVTTKDSVPTTEDLYAVLTAINGAFAGPVDTISYATKTVLTGVADLKSCTFLYAVPGVIPASIIPGKVVDQTPVAYELGQNYPNPFNPMTTIDFSLPQYGLVTLKVYNMLGQEVATLLDNVEFEEGQQSVDFDGSALASGVYFYRLTIQGMDDEGAVEGQSFSQVKKMLLVK